MMNPWFFFFFSNPGAGLVYDLRLAEQAAGIGLWKRQRGGWRGVGGG